MSHPDSVLAQIDQEFPRSLDRLFELLRFPSVATDPRHDADCLKAAQWLAEQLRGLRFEAALRRTTGQTGQTTTTGPGVAEQAAAQEGENLAASPISTLPMTYPTN